MRRSVSRATSSSWVAITIVTLALSRKRVQRRHDLLGRVGVEVAGRLVGDDDTRAVGQGPGDGDALLLTTGEPGRQMTHARAEADLVQQHPGTG